jgi:hypothetical protein
MFCVGSSMSQVLRCTQLCDLITRRSLRSSFFTNSYTAAGGIVKLPRVRRQDSRRDDWSEGSRRILGEFGEFAPCNELCCKLFAIQ